MQTGHDVQDTGYFSSEPWIKRKRVADSVQPGQCVVNLFAGMGLLSILIGKHVPGSRMAEVDKNQAAIQCPGRIQDYNLDTSTAVEDMPGALGRRMIAFDRPCHYEPAQFWREFDKGGEKRRHGAFL